PWPTQAALVLASARQPRAALRTGCGPCSARRRPRRRRIRYAGGAGTGAAPFLNRTAAAQSRRMKKTAGRPRRKVATTNRRSTSGGPIAGRLPVAHHGHDLFGEQFHALPGVLVGHAGEAEAAIDVHRADDVLDALDALQTLRRGTPD